MPISSFIMLFFDFTTVALHHLELKITLMYLIMDLVAAPQFILLEKGCLAHLSLILYFSSTQLKKNNNNLFI